MKKSRDYKIKLFKALENYWLRSYFLVAKREIIIRIESIKLTYEITYSLVYVDKANMIKSETKRYVHCSTTSAKTTKGPKIKLINR